MLNWDDPINAAAKPQAAVMTPEIPVDIAASMTDIVSEENDHIESIWHHLGECRRVSCLLGSW